MDAHHGCREGTEQVMVCGQKEEQGRRKVGDSMSSKSKIF